MAVRVGGRGGSTSLTAPPTERIESQDATLVRSPSASCSLSSGVTWSTRPLLISGRLWPP